MLRRSAFNLWSGRLAIAALILMAAQADPALAERPRTIIVSTGAIAAAPDGRSTLASFQGESRSPRQGRIVSSQIEIARERARLQLELDDGRSLDFALRDDQLWVGNRSLGEARRGDAFDRAWRDLLTRAIDTPTEELMPLLTGWTPPASGPGLALQRELTSALSDIGPGGTMRAAGDEDASFDTVAALNRRIAELQRRLEDEPTQSSVTTTRRRPHVVTTIELGRGNAPWYAPLRHLGRGFMGILSDLVILAVLVGIGFATVFFARKKLEAVADTARNETLRAGLVGLAATFLILPGYILGIIALAISIVGIPLLLAWVPLFWVAVGVAILLGYLAVGHAVGEGLAERRFYGGEWASRANSYYYVLTGLAALFAFFLASHAVQMAGPWLGFIRGLLMFLGVVLTWAAFTIGFGAVLLTRAGTRLRPGHEPPAPADLDMGDLFEEESHV
jgi:hypothetical protein